MYRHARIVINTNGDEVFHSKRKLLAILLHALTLTGISTRPHTPQIFAGGGCGPLFAWQELNGYAAHVYSLGLQISN